MERRPLGSTGLEASIIGMGTWRTFDVPAGDERAVELRREIVYRALDAGMNLFDSSPMYGWAEEVLGLSLGERRQDVLIATKVWSGDIQQGAQQIDRSFTFFGGCVEVFQVHNLIEWEHYLDVLRGYRDEGRVRAIGVTHYARSAFPRIMRIMERESIDCVQIPYDAADPRAAQEVLSLAAETNTGVIVMSPLRTGDLVRAQPPVGELEPLRDYGVTTWAQALLKWVVSDPRVTTAIPATSRPERSEENARAGDPPLLPEEQRERVAWLAARALR